MSFSKIAQLTSQLFFHNVEKWPETLYKDIIKSCTIEPNFLKLNEEQNLLKEIEPHMKRLRYEKNHWDDVGLDFFCLEL